MDLLLESAEMKNLVHYANYQNILRKRRMILQMINKRYIENIELNQIRSKLYSNDPIDPILSNICTNIYKNMKRILL